ncbi:WzyE family oligosaccharide polymerase [Aliivibrio fischeri]|uniref:Common antigen polymerase n=1 Tax=Aliivibrio fischeri SR5 TaxID=1088719 RepID=A0AAV3EX48_ALIFS|nr:WzyE family oligosaccharide polymerase [Aliivibrio fischeri]EHN71533.1 putative common antigen polymerase [Aliivibrio fischeri SR5]
MLFICVFFALFLSFYYGRIQHAGVHYYVFLLFYSICHFSYFFSKEYLLSETLIKIEVDIFAKSIITFIVIVITYLLLTFTDKKRSHLKNNSIDFSYKKSICIIFFLLYCLGVILYIMKNGISFGADYNSRISKNAGGGLAIILMYSYVPCILVLYSIFNSKSGLIVSFIFCIVFGLLYYIIIGGSRNLLGAGVFVLIYMAVIQKHISIKKVIVISGVGLVSLIGMEIYRYSNDISDVLDFFSSEGIKSLSFIFESFSPMFSVINISDAIKNNFIEPQGIKTFLNEFGILIPRFLWPDKPLNVFNNGYFYTSEVLKIDTNLTMSPTLLGSFIIMFGNNYYWILGVVTGVILYLFDDKLKYSRNNFTKMTILSSIGYLFFWVRDGFEVYCYVIIKFWLAITLARLIYSFFVFLTPKKFNL